MANMTLFGVKTNILGYIISLQKPGYDEADLSFYKLMKHHYFHYNLVELSKSYHVKVTLQFYVKVKARFIFANASRSN